MYLSCKLIVEIDNVSFSTPIGIVLIEPNWLATNSLSTTSGKIGIFIAL